MKAFGLALPLVIVAASASAQGMTGSMPGASPGSAMPGSAMPGSAMPGGAMPGGAAPGGLGQLSAANGLAPAPPAGSMPSRAAAGAARLPPPSGGPMTAAAVGVAGARGTMTAVHGQVYETAGAAGVPETLAFMTIENQGSTPDTLTALSCPLADTTTLVGADGKPVTNLQIASGQPATMAPKALHITLQNTHFQVAPGAIVPCTLTFQNAGQIQVMLTAHKAPAP